MGQLEARLGRCSEHVGWEYFCVVGKYPLQVSWKAPSLLWFKSNISVFSVVIHSYSLSKPDEII